MQYKLIKEDAQDGRFNAKKFQKWKAEKSTKQSRMYIAANFLAAALIVVKVPYTSSLSSSQWIAEIPQ